jgi:hypothetical protein
MKVNRYEIDNKTGSTICASQALTVGGYEVMRVFRAIGVRLAIVALLSIGTAHADDWIGGTGLTISALEPLATYEGGVVRVFLSSPINVPYCGNSSGQASMLHFLFTNGTQESRSALVAGLYVAFAEGKTVAVLLSSSGCSPDGSPVLVGMHVNQ